MELITIGIDGHKSTLAACAVDLLGRRLATAEVPNDPAGHAELRAWAVTAAPARVWAIESARGWPRLFTEALVRAGEHVVDVPGRMTQRERRRLRRIAKSDASDALAIARVALREPLERVRVDDTARELKLLVDYRRGLTYDRTRLANQVHADLVTLTPGYERHIPTLTSGLRLRRAAALLGEIEHAQARLGVRRIGRLLELDQEIRAIEREISRRVESLHSGLVEIVGLGPILAATILGEVGDIRRIPTREKFAAMNGTAPVAACSGRTQRHRLNRLGNRKLNYALHAIALTQARCDPRARAYIQKHLARGKSRRDAIRALKRRLSDVVYRQLVSDAAPRGT